jgi:hypothetical protein
MAHIEGGLDFGGALSMPGVADNGAITPTDLPNKFSGALAPLDPCCLPPNLADLSGTVNGSFVRPIDVETHNPKGVIGNWNIGNSHYNATGIFAGSLAAHGD